MESGPEYGKKGVKQKGKGVGGDQGGKKEKSARTDHVRGGDDAAVVRGAPLLCRRRAAELHGPVLFGTE